MFFRAASGMFRRFPASYAQKFRIAASGSAVVTLAALAFAAQPVRLDAGLPPADVFLEPDTQKPVLAKRTMQDKEFQLLGCGVRTVTFLEVPVR